MQNPKNYQIWSSSFRVVCHCVSDPYSPVIRHHRKVLTERLNDCSLEV